MFSGAPGTSKMPIILTVVYDFRIRVGAVAPVLTIRRPVVIFTNYDGVRTNCSKQLCIGKSVMANYEMNVVDSE